MSDAVWSAWSGRRRREDGFSEPVPARLRRIAFGLAWRVKNDGALGTARLAGMHIKSLRWPERLPPDGRKPFGTDGWVGVATDMSVETLREGYARGLYPFSHVLAPKWASPAERSILPLDRIHLSKRLRSQIRQEKWTVTFDTAFADVMRACAEPRPGQWSLTWISPRMMRAYMALHQSGDAHSFEVWDCEDNLVGGGYGVATGRCFTIESQFHRVDNASKVGFAHLLWHLARWGFALADNKRPAEAVRRFGFQSVTREEFHDLLLTHRERPDAPARWQVEATAADVAAGIPTARAGLSEVPASEQA